MFPVNLPGGAGFIVALACSVNWLAELHSGVGIYPSIIEESARSPAGRSKLLLASWLLASEGLLGNFGQAGRLNGLFVRGVLMAGVSGCCASTLPTLIPL